MTYLEARERFESTPQFSTTATLDRIKFLLAALGNPETHLKLIHIAGTNGKGSTSTMTARILEEHGYQTGLFLSPYVVTFRERVSIAGVPISEETFALLAERVLSVANVMLDPPNFFELMTALALLYFVESGCEFAVLEVGMGGRLDATNAIPAPLVSAITPISLDHTKYLGNTTEKIAEEKCGILKPGSIAVSSLAQPSGAMDAIVRICKERKIPLMVPHLAKDVSCTLHSTRFSYDGISYRLRLLGQHQVDNACTVLMICDALRAQGISLDPMLCKAGMEKAALPARLEVLSRDPICILDGGHNPAGVSALFQFLSQNRPRGRVITVFGCLKDKGFSEMAKTVSENSDVTIVTSCPSPRTCSFCDLIPHLEGDSYDIPENRAALQAAYEMAENCDLIVICGSLYLAGSIKQITN